MWHIAMPGAGAIHSINGAAPLTVGQRHPHQHRRLARQHPRQPGAWSGRLMDMALDDDAVGAKDQQSPQRAFAHLRRGAEPLLAAGRVLPGRETQPGGEVPSLAERPGRRGQDREGRGDQRTDARHRHQAPSHLVLLRSPGDLWPAAGFVDTTIGS